MHHSFSSTCSLCFLPFNSTRDFDNQMVGWIPENNRTKYNIDNGNPSSYALDTVKTVTKDSIVYFYQQLVGISL